MRVGNTYGAQYGGDVGKRIGERIGRSVGGRVGGIAAALVAGSIAHRIFYSLAGKLGKEPSRDQLISQLIREQDKLRMQIEMNQRAAMGTGHFGRQPGNLRLEQQLDEIQDQLDMLSRLRESSSPSFPLMPIPSHQDAQDVSGRLEEGVGSALVRGVGRAALNVGKHVVQSGLKKVGAKSVVDAGKSAASSGLQKISQGAFGAVKNVARAGFRAAGNAVKSAGGHVAHAAGADVQAARKTGLTGFLKGAGTTARAAGVDAAAAGRTVAKPVVSAGRAALNTAGRVGKAAAVGTGKAISSAANLAFNPSQVAGNALAHKPGAVGKVGKFFSAANMDKSWDTIRSKPIGGAGVGQRLKAFGKIAAGSTADGAITGAAVGAGTALAGKRIEKNQHAPGTARSQALDSTANSVNHAMIDDGAKTQTDSQGNPSPGPEYKMTFGQWRKRKNPTEHPAGQGLHS